MKKFLVSILTIAYFLTSSGAVINMHFCMGRVASWEIGSDRSKACAHCGMQKKEVRKASCCNDELARLLNHSDQRNPEPLIQFTQFHGALTPTWKAESTRVFSRFVKRNKTVPGGRYPGREVKVYIRNCVFRI